MVLNFIFNIFFNKKYKIKYQFIIILFVWLYIFVTGMSISSQRAALMITIFIISYYHSKLYYTFNSLLLSAFILLLINPYLLYDIGFELSFTAVLG
jgi:competence protein ComEC